MQFRKIISMSRKFFKRLKYKEIPKILTDADKIIDYKNLGSIPWSDGYHEYKWKNIEEGINNEQLLKGIKNYILPTGYGTGIDERVVEYPWLFSKIDNGISTFLDAGSTFNFETLLKVPLIKEKEKYIYTFYPEHTNFLNDRISYAFGDLRDLPFKDNFFDTVVCHSTLEHIDMDNSMYGYELSHIQEKNIKSYEYLKVISELARVTKSKGKILLTFPYGKFENHGFFQQFDKEMVEKIIETLSLNFKCNLNFTKYEIDGWHFAAETECKDSVSFNPHTGVGKGEDGAAHSRAICFVEATKN